MKKILFPTAYSPSSKNSWQYALKLASHFDAEITLLHVIEDSEAKIDKVRELDRLYDFAIVFSGSEYEDVLTDFMVTQGKVIDVILQEESNYDLIIMGTSTINAFPEKVIGDVALAVANKATSSLLLVPPMKRYNGVSCITYATNQSLSNTETLSYLSKWVDIFDSEYQLLHISKQTLEDNKDMDDLVNKYQEENQEVTFSYRIMEGDFIAQIEYLLELDKSDLLVLNFPKTGFINLFFKQNIIRKITADSMMPVLIIKE